MMRRDLSVMRKLILELEEAPAGIESVDIDLDIPQDVVEYHLLLMAESGLRRTTRMRGSVLVNGMTCDGHDFADAARDSTLWRRTLKSIKTKASSVPFDVLMHTLKSAAAKLLSDG